MKYQESEIIELKEKYIDDLKKEIVAFANTHGGTIYLGIDDNGNAVGLEDIDSVLLQITNTVRDSIKPDLSMLIEYRKANIEGKDVLEVIIEQGVSKPYYIAKKGLRPEGVYVRQGSSSAPSSEGFIRQMIKQSDGESFELCRAIEQKLTFVTAKKEFEERNLKFENQQMISLGLIKDDMYTNLAYLLSDQCPHIIDAAKFNGLDTREFQDRKQFTGSILKQLNDAYEYLDKFNFLRSTINGLRRKDKQDYPKECLREALINAIVHRDYSTRANTLLKIFDNRIEVISCGGIVGNMSINDVVQGISIRRNERLADVFYRLELVEAYGTGISKIKNPYVDMLSEPSFIVTDNVFKVVIPNMNCIEDINEIEPEFDDEFEEILNHIKEKEMVSRSELEKELHTSSSTVVRLLKKAKDQNYISTIGNGKNIKYVLNKMK